MDNFRATAAVTEAFGQFVAGTYPGHPQPGPVGRAVRSASKTVTDLATTAKRGGDVVKRALPASAAGVVNQIGAGVKWAATPVTGRPVRLPPGRRRRASGRRWPSWARA